MYQVGWLQKQSGPWRSSLVSFRYSGTWGLRRLVTSTLGFQDPLGHLSSKGPLKEPYYGPASASGDTSHQHAFHWLEFKTMATLRRPLGDAVFYKLCLQAQENLFWSAFGSFSHHWMLRRELMLGSVSDVVFMRGGYIFFFSPHGPFGAATQILLFESPQISDLFVPLIFVTDSFRRDSVSSA